MRSDVGLKVLCWMMDFNFVVRLHCFQSHETEIKLLPNRNSWLQSECCAGPRLMTIQTGFKQTAKVYKHKVHMPLEIDDDSTSCDCALAVPCYVFTFDAAKVGIDFELVVHTLTIKSEDNNVFWH